MKYLLLLAAACLGLSMTAAAVNVTVTNPAIISKSALLLLYSERFQQRPIRSGLAYLSRRQQRIYRGQ